MSKYFKTYTANMNQAQKKKLYDDYKYTPMYDHTPITFKQFFDQENILEMISMKCLYCNYELNVSYFLYQYPVNENLIPFPFDECPNCGNHQFVPKDVYDKLNS